MIVGPSGKLDTRWARGASVALASMLALNCGASSDTTAPETAAPTDVIYTMTSSEFLPSQNLPPNLLVVMTVQNVSLNTVEKTYPAGCPLRIRIYRVLDDSLLFDETRRACPYDARASLRLEPGASRSIGSGFRDMTQIMGDSIPCGRYRLVGVPQTEGKAVIEIEAGEAYLRAYPDWPAPNPNAARQC